MLTLAHLLVRVVVGNALLLDRWHQLRPLRPALRTVAAHRTSAAHAACRTGAALRTIPTRREIAALRTIPARREIAALRTISARREVAALRTIPARRKIAALRTIPARREVAALRTIPARREAAALRARRIAALLGARRRSGLRFRLRFRFRFRLRLGRLNRRFLLGLLHRHVIGHRPCLALRAERLLLFLAALLLALGLLLLRKAVFNLAQLGERLLRCGTNSRYVSQQLRRPAAEFLCCVLNLHFGHSALAPPQIASLSCGYLP